MSRLSLDKAPEHTHHQETTNSKEREQTPRPSHLAQNLLALQRTAGNQAVTHLLQKAQHISSTQGTTIHAAPSWEKHGEAGHQAQAAANPLAIQAKLGSGRSLESGTKGRMESAFGRGFSHVRIHTNTQAAALSAGLNARAFTIGRDIAFGVGEYQPGTLIGDALIAHELAHVIQQGGASKVIALLEVDGASYNALEADADASAAGAMVSLWAGAKGEVKGIAKNVLPRLRSGLGLQRAPRLRGGTVSGPTAEDCGAFRWGFQWYLEYIDRGEEDPSISGVIVQSVETDFDIKDCNGEPVEARDNQGKLVRNVWPFWEAWQVRKGKVFAGGSRNPHTADIFTAPSQPDGTKGSMTFRGSANYYPNQPIPDSFEAQPGHPAGNLPSAANDPQLQGGTGTLDREIKSTWNCCPGSKDRRTILTFNLRRR
jgi:hypothetical protein